ncbi:MAG: hypothetical protein AABY26_06970, partial [Nanoarchaeota archaeon]
NQFNFTIIWNFTISQAVSAVNLTINGSKNNFTINNGTSLLLNCSRINGENNIYLYNNGTIIHSGSNLVTNLTQFNNSGTFNITCAHNATQNYSSNAESYWVTVALTSDTLPIWYGNWSSIVSTYSNTTLSKFNISWNDDYNVSLVYFESNYSGAAVNYTMTLSVGNITDGTYNYSVIIPAGSHYWKSHARDNSNQWNSTYSWNFTINQINSSVNLTLAGSRANASITAGDSLNLSCTKLSGESSIYLYREGTLLNSGISTVSNLTTFSSAGTFNITCTYNTTQNYTSSTETYWVIASAPAPSSSSSSGGGSSSSSSGGGTTGGETTRGGTAETPSLPTRIVTPPPREVVEVVPPEEAVAYVRDYVNIEVTPAITAPTVERTAEQEAIAGRAITTPQDREIDTRPLIQPEIIKVVIENRG